MLRIGSIILTVWCALNMLPALGVVVYVALVGGTHPLLLSRFSDLEIAAIPAGVLDTINGMAAFANGHVFGLCLLSLPVIWMGLGRRNVWAFWALLAAMSVSVLAGFVGVYVDQTHYYWPSIVSALLVGAGFACVASDLFHSS